jgi:adenosylmethionine-8-amino-7-oxononanoate aminotransferase
MAATLTTARVWNAFLGTHADQRTFFHGHTYGGNPLAAAVGLDLVADRATGQGYPWQERRGARACLAARKHGAILRQLGDTVVIMPPLSITLDELDLLAAATEAGIRDATASGSPIA